MQLCVNDCNSLLTPVQRWCATYSSKQKHSIELEHDYAVLCNLLKGSAIAGLVRVSNGLATYIKPAC
eukprot:scaffold359378_cov22-Prasinocladus_malaysianus.AAC.1